METNEAADAPEVTYCYLLPGHRYCTAVHIHTRFCLGGVEVPQGDFAWLTPGPWRERAVEIAKDAEAGEGEVVAPVVASVPARRPRSRTLAMLGLALGLSACHATVATVEVESVGSLTASASHVMVQPVHAGTDLSGGFQAVSSDADDDTSSFSTSTEAAKEEECPAVAPKAGLTMGVAR